MVQCIVSGTSHSQHLRHLLCNLLQNIKSQLGMYLVLLTVWLTLSPVFTCRRSMLWLLTPHAYPSPSPHHCPYRRYEVVYTSSNRSHCPPEHPIILLPAASSPLNSYIIVFTKMVGSCQLQRRHSCSSSTIFHIPSNHNQSKCTCLQYVIYTHNMVSQPPWLKQHNYGRRLLRGIKRIHADSRLSITPNLLRSFLHFLDFRYPDHITLWAAMLVVFFGFLQSNELLALQHNDLQRTPEGYLLLIRSSKTDPFCSGAMVSLTPSGDDGLCAMAALHLLRAKTSFNAGPLFRFLSGAALTRHKLNHLIQELAACSGVPPGCYSSHSFRIGAASTAAATGIPDWKIQALGRWSSDCYKCYIRLPNAETNTVAAAMAQTHL